MKTLLALLVALPMLAQAQVRSFTAELYPDKILVNAVTRVPVPGQILPMRRGPNVAYLDTTDLACPVELQISEDGKSWRRVLTVTGKIVVILADNAKPMLFVRFVPITIAR